MNESTLSSTDDEIDLLDLLVTVAESWKLLVFVPVLVGMVAFTGATFLKPSFYQSSAILRFSEDQVSVLHSAPVLNPLTESFGYLSEAQGIREDAREALKKDLLGAVDKQSKLVTITAMSSSPEQAQKLNQQAVQLLLEELTPKGLAKANILQLIEFRKQAIAAAETSFKQLVPATSKGGSGVVDAEQTSASISSLVTLMLDNKNAIQVMEQLLVVQGSEVFVQPATLPQKEMPRKRAMVAAMAVLASGFALLFFVFIRKALLNAGTNPESAAKIARIKQSFGFSPKAP
jgi:LPS O-antigen subunit length determinant protein (WzzB/FepE family)